jgi:hypothetical protein
MSGSQQLLIARHSFNLIKFSEDNLIRFDVAELFQSKCVSVLLAHKLHGR